MRLQNNRVVWSEGLFLRPQHFQQNERFVENLVESRAASLHPFPWGFSTLTIDSDALKFNRIALTACEGVLPDGTCFSVPDQSEPPDALVVADGAANETVMLSIPLRRNGSVQTTRSETPNPLARYVTRELESYDATVEQSQAAEISVGEPHLRLLNGHDDHDNFVTMPLCRIQEAQANEGITLDNRFIPPILNIGVSSKLVNFINEILGFMLERGQALSITVGMAETGGVSQVSDFLFLQLLNRHVPVIHHLSTLRDTHPELLYRSLIALAGELAGFSRADHLAVRFPGYHHDDLTASFEPVIDELRRAFAAPTTSRVLSLPVEMQSHGVRTVRIDDRTLLDSASFVLAVHADVDPVQLQNEFPQHIKISPVEHIGQLVQGGYSGIVARYLPTAPRAIPYHDGFTYFELERKGNYWELLEDSAALAIHIPNRYPDIKIEMWAVRNLRNA